MCWSTFPYQFRCKQAFLTRSYWLKAKCIAEEKNHTLPGILDFPFKLSLLQFSGIMLINIVDITYNIKQVGMGNRFWNVILVHWICLDKTFHKLIVIWLGLQLKLKCLYLYLIIL